ncbi:hypothetical protein ACTJIJ_21120 [Niabella sp. 22666]|uniref:hypothetical protein n=1 Tax=Niabella sp. 22666 TaxID=3453954 RepID=UPI003F86CF11
MKKVILVCDGENYSHGVFELIKQSQQHEALFVKGIFFSSIDIVASVARDFWEEKASINGVASMAVERFANQCKNNNIQFAIEERDASYWSKVFWQKESRFADYIILSQAMIGKDVDSKQPNAFMQELFRWADCPILVVPENIKKIESLIATYDGSRECMHAIKEFTKIFPWYCNLPASFVYVKDEDNADIPQSQLLKEFVNIHFQNAVIQKLHWDYQKLFSTWIECHKNPLIIAGSYNRSIVSYLLETSFSDLIIKDQIAPIFIAH